jgi:hypothetical protein
MNEDKQARANALMREAAELLGWDAYAIGDEDEVLSFLITGSLTRTDMLMRDNEAKVVQLRREEPKPKIEMVQCPTCGGGGRKWLYHSAFQGNVYDRCDRCEGRGKVRL